MSYEKKIIFWTFFIGNLIGSGTILFTVSLTDKNFINSFVSMFLFVNILIFIITNKQWYDVYFSKKRLRPTYDSEGNKI